jgi:hypothetical protein
MRFECWRFWNAGTQACGFEEIEMSKTDPDAPATDTLTASDWIAEADAKARRRWEDEQAARKATFEPFIIGPPFAALQQEERTKAAKARGVEIWQGFRAT